MNEPVFLGAANDVKVHHLQLPVCVFPSLFAGPPYVLNFHLGWWIAANGWESVVG